MKQYRSFVIVVVLLGLSLMTACGGGGGGGAAPGPPPAVSTQAVLTVSTAGSIPAGVDGINGVDVTIVLPSGASVGTSAVTPAGSWQMPLGSVYTAPTGTYPGTVRFIVYYSGSSGLPTGTFATVVSDLTKTTIVAGDFTIDLASTEVTGVTVSPYSQGTITSGVTTTLSVHFQ